MFIHRAVAILALAGILCVTMAQAQEPTPSPELVKMSNLAFGWVSMSGVDPTLDLLTQFAPTMMCLQDYGCSSGGETVVGQFTFGDFEVTADFESAITRLGPGMVRISHFGYNSNTAEIVASPGVLWDVHGDSIELSYAQHVGRGTVGISYVPQDSSYLELESGGLKLANGNTETDWGVRVGGIYRLGDEVRLGADYSYQKDSGVIALHPALTDQPDWITQREDFITRCATVGASWEPTAKTSVYGAYQQIVASGGTIGQTQELVWFGVQQHINEHFAARLNYLDGGLNTSVMWVSPVGIFNAAYTHKALLNAEEYLGIGDSLFVSLAVGF